MGVLPDWMLRNHVAVTPFAENEPREGKISYGLSSYGYDARLGYRFKVFKNTSCGVIDPKKFDPNAFEEAERFPTHKWGHAIRDMKCTVACRLCGKERPLDGGGTETCPEAPDHILIPPNSFVLGETLETFTVPRDCIAVCLGKSTYARCGIIVNVTPLEPEWTGKVTVEISNTAPLPAKVYAGEGIMQVLFLRTDGYNPGFLLKTLADELGLGRPKKDDGSVDYELWSWTQWKAFEHVMNTMAELEDTGTCKVSYADKKGIYQSQTGVTPPKVRE